jgi:hypothetical protein
LGSGLAVLLAIGPGGASAGPAPEAPEADGRALVLPAVERPATAELRACSFREPVCVHDPGRVAPRRIEPILATAERAIAGLRALGMNPPRDGGPGGSQAFDIYLASDGEAAAWPDGRRTTTTLDQVSAFALLPASLSGCARESAVVRVIAQAALLDLDAAIHEAVLALQSSHMASLLAPCTAVEAAAIDRFQRTPERALARGRRGEVSGAMLFSAYLDEEHGLGKPGAVMNSVVALASQQTAPDARYWENEPDVFDLLRRLLPPAGMSFPEAMGDFAVARAFVGSRSDGQHLSGTARFGDFGRVRFEWSVPYASLPRRLAPRVPIEATGATYLWVDLKGVARERGLLAAMEWDTSFVFHWSAVRVDAEGRELGRMKAGGVFGHHEAQLTIEQLDGAAGLILVGTNLGSDDRSRAYDPDRGGPGEAGYELTLHPR